MRLPKKYQNVSLTSEPVAATSTTSGEVQLMLSRQRAGRQQQWRAGIGSPACSASTQKNSRSIAVLHNELKSLSHDESRQARLHYSDARRAAKVPQTP